MHCPDYCFYVFLFSAERVLIMFRIKRPDCPKVLSNKTKYRRRCGGILLFSIIVGLLFSRQFSLMAIGGYQRFISPHKGWRCAYSAHDLGASCSEYMKIMIREHGLFFALQDLPARAEACQAASWLPHPPDTSRPTVGECSDCADRAVCWALICSKDFR